MKSTAKIGIGLGVGLVAGFAAWVYNSIRVAKNLVFTFGLPRNVAFSGGVVTFDLPTTIRNPVTASLTINSLSVDIMAFGTYIGTTNIFSPIRISGLSMVLVVPNFRVDAFQVVALLPRAVAGVLNVSYSGFASVSGFRIPISQDNTLNIRDLTK